MSTNPKMIQVDSSTPLIEAMKVIDNGNIQIVFVVNYQEKLIGTLTDGDIRRALISGQSLEASVEIAMNRSFYSVKEGFKLGKVIEIMKKKSIHQVPILNQEEKVVDVILLDEYTKKTILDNPVVVMAGGRGKRLSPFTDNCPKPMLKVNGTPMLEIILNQYLDVGFKNFFFSVNYLKESITDYFKDGSEWGANIQYLHEDSPLGTAGSLCLLPKNIKKTIIITNGDVLTQFNPGLLLKFHQEQEVNATICVREHEIQIPFGVIEVKEGKLDKFTEKPSYRTNVNAGIYAINPELLNILNYDEFLDMPDLLLRAKSMNFNVSVFPIHEYWLDIGRPETLKQATREWIE